MIDLPLPVAGIQTGSPADPRIQSVPYMVDQVVPLRVSPGFAATVELLPDDRIETIVLGNSDGWQVTAGRAGDRLAVKPLPGAVTTNMIVLAGSRRYVLLLSVEASGGVFALRFVAPAGPALSGTARAADYRLSGERSLFPVAMSDDGRRTTISWGLQTSMPALFAIDERGREGLVNGRMVDGDYVVEGVARRYVLRLGRARAVATRRVIATRP